MTLWKKRCFVGLLLLLALPVSAQMPNSPALVGTDGAPFQLDEYSDRLLLINFWATWCAPCLIEMPDLDELRGRYDEQQFTVLGIAADTPVEVAEFVGKLGIGYPIAVGEPDAVFAWTAELGNRAIGLPFSVLFDRSGSIRWVKAGGRISVSETVTLIDQLLDEEQ